MKLHHIKLARDRRSFIEKETGTTLGNVGTFTFDEKTVSSRHCENLIGAVQVPLGIAGPVTISSRQSENKSYFLPLATTEGALVASVSRGCKAIVSSGGAYAHADRAGVTRAPVFHISSRADYDKLHAWLHQHRANIKAIAQDTSQHLKLLDIEEIYAAPYMFLRLRFDTQDAMGMNMVTIAADHVVAHIEKETGTSCLGLSGNVDVDKKPAWQNMVSGRGWRVSAEVLLSKETLATVLKTDASSCYATWISKCMVGSAVSGSMGFNAHMANILAALFIATGQDPAHVAECAIGMTVCEKRADDLFVSIQLPDLMIGTVGGGTSLSTQEEALSIMGVSGAGKAEEFACIVAGAVLAGEISLLASLSEGSLARAHKTLGRGEVL